MKISLDELLPYVLTQLSHYEREKFRASLRVHLAILCEPYLQWILQGKKTIESRFSVRQGLPYRRVSIGDILLLKRTSGPVVAYCSVEAVIYATRKPEDLYWQLHQFSKDTKYATLMRVHQVQHLDPIEVGRARGDRRPWIILRDSSERTR